MKSTIKQLGRKTFSKFNNIVPNRVKWEIMGLFPIQYLNIVSTESPEEFLESGREQVDDIISELESYDRSFSIEDANVLEIGTGPGRLVSNFARHTDNIYGVDISTYNLKKAEKLCESQGTKPVLKRSEKGLPNFQTEFDLIYSVIVFQHMKRRNTLKYIIHSFSALR